MTMFGYNILGFGSTLANAGAAAGFFATGGNTITGAGLILSTLLRLVARSLL